MCHWGPFGGQCYNHWRTKYKKFSYQVSNTQNEFLCLITLKRYDLLGYVSELPLLLEGRSSHGCGAYMVDSNTQVSIKGYSVREHLYRVRFPFGVFLRNEQSDLGSSHPHPAPLLAEVVSFHYMTNHEIHKKLWSFNMIHHVVHM